MHFPIRLKLVHRDTGETYRQYMARLTRQTRPLLPPKSIMALTGHGRLLAVDGQGRSDHCGHLDPTEWQLHVATTKNADGQWIYNPLLCSQDES